MTLDEKELLRNWYRYGPSALVRDRAHAVLINDQGINVRQTARLLFRDYKTVRFWLASFKKRRLSSLFPKYKGNNNAGKLTRAQREKISKVLSRPPSEYGIPKEFWQVTKPGWSGKTNQEGLG